MRELEIEVGEIHGMRHDLAEHPIEAPVVQAARAQNQVAGNVQRIGGGGRGLRL